MVEKRGKTSRAFPEIASCCDHIARVERLKTLKEEEEEEGEEEEEEEHCRQGKWDRCGKHLNPREHFSNLLQKSCLQKFLLET